MDKEESFRNSTYEDQINVAQRELSAFILAVMELFGPEEARLSTEDWLDKSELMGRPLISALKKMISLAEAFFTGGTI